ncbi:hypothetical protein L596_025823 [Steinernema carpocapsae]|uniref:Uncharacterized protein n=1 Tax=Steinernema carpocapsae TaxID=34508 RepID=A0A4U5M8Y6_STECR|nr:hypothetical protein L596_025823 [Steinernema carpocapsae]
MPEHYPLAKAAWISVKKLITKEALDSFNVLTYVPGRNVTHEKIEIYMDVPSKYKLRWLMLSFASAQGRKNIG